MLFSGFCTSLPVYTIRIGQRTLKKQSGGRKTLRSLEWLAMKNLTSSTWIKLKGFLFLFLGLLSTALLLFEHPTLKVGLLVALAVWAFCRFYYFAFYVIEHYVDPSYRFSGLLSLTRYLLGKKRQAS
jgi:hypothetical protein